MPLGRDFGKQVGDLGRDVRPPRRQQVHLYDGVAIVLKCAGGQEAAAVFRRVGIGVWSCAAGSRAAESVPIPLRRMVRIRLAVGDVACQIISLR